MFSGIKLSHLAQWTKGILNASSGQDPIITEISSDTRTVKAGDCFAAIRGERYDGHEFLDDAAKKGVAAILCERPFASSIPVLVVPNTVEALAHIGEALRQRFSGPVFAVTGSAGKSSTKEALAVALGEGTLCSPASFNNLLGVSKTLFLIEDRHQRLILEMGMNGLGEIREMCERFRPTAGLITNIGDAHIGKLGGKEGIYRAKKEMFDYLAAQPSTLGVAVNVDDPLVVKAFEATFGGSGKVIRYSVNPNSQAEVKALRSQMDPRSGYLRLELSVMGETLPLHLPIYGLHFSQNIAAAAAGALLLGVTARDLAERLPQFQPASHRGHILHQTNERILIDESYNSNPSALTSSLQSCAHFDRKRPRLFVLGEMRELGEFSTSLHESVGGEFAKLFHEVPFTLIAVGEGMKAFLERVRVSQPTQATLHWVANGVEALPLVNTSYKPGTICLVKGSRGIKLDEVVEKLKQT